MATQEIGLNEALEAEGIAAWETDLAELIVQLGDDLPSAHPGAGDPPQPRRDPRDLPPRDGRRRPARARRPHRRAGRAGRRPRGCTCGRSSCGPRSAVSGANFAVAETGTLVVVESEGNGRMCLTLPEVLVSVVGHREGRADLGGPRRFLQLLPRSSTGERMNPYTSTWTGVTPGDGPQEVHVVLLDNGRTRALADEVGRQALRCIRCSACLNVCPVYERVGGHAYGSVYPGPIGAILNPLLKGVGVDEQTDSLPYASSLCGACFEVCPVRIDIPEVLVHLRAQVVDAHRGDRVPKAEALAMRAAAWSFTRQSPPRPGAERASGVAGRVLGRVGRDAAGRPRRAPPVPGRARLDRRPRPARTAAGVLPRLVATHDGGAAR